MEEKNELAPFDKLQADSKLKEDMLKAFDEIQMPRSQFVLEKMVVGGHETVEKQYSHCVLEMQIAYDNLRIAQSNVELAQIEMDELPKDRKGELKRKIKEVELGQYNRACIGAMREFVTLFALWQKFPKKFTREELDQAEPLYWDRRLTGQANRDVLATGRVGQGNQQALQQIGKGVSPQLNQVQDVERRYLEEGHTPTVFVCVPSAEKFEVSNPEDIPCLKGLFIPATIKRRYHNAYGRQVAEHYNEGAMIAAQTGADFMLTVETDTFAPPDAFVRLLALALKNPHCAVGAWYPKREHPRQGVHIVQKNGMREFLPDDGGVHEVFTLAMGCSLYPVEIFLKVPQPWFATTNVLSQDSFFSQLARENGFRLLVDTSIKCKHIDSTTKEVFE